MPIKYIIASRRLNYLHNILARNENELVSRIFSAQFDNPLEGDFVKLIEEDFKLINEKFNKTLIKSMTKKQFKKWVKSKIEKAAFEFLIEEKVSQSKICDIEYKKLEIQNYLKAAVFNNSEIELLFKLRSKTLELKSNYKKKYFNKLDCSLKDCYFEENQEHLFSSCQILQNKLRVKDKTVSYKDIFSRSTKKQNKVTKIFSKLLDIRTDLLNSYKI